MQIGNRTDAFCIQVTALKFSSYDLTAYQFCGVMFKISFDLGSVENTPVNRKSKVLLPIRAAKSAQRF
jgi:hypothetical protein